MMMQIGAVAKQCGIGVETVRFYEREGLISEPSRSVSGYRQYSEIVLKQIQFVQYAKSVGFSLKDIRELLKLKHRPDTTCEEARSKLLDKVDEIQQKITALEKMKAMLLPLIDQCQADGKLADCAVLQTLETDPMIITVDKNRGKSRDDN